MAGLTKMPLGMEVGISPGHIELDEDPAASPPKKVSVPHFRPMSIVAKRSPISATAEHLLYFTYVHNRQFSESQQKISSLTEQLERKTTVNSAAGDVHGSENGPEDVSLLKVHLCVVI